MDNIIQRCMISYKDNTAKRVFCNILAIEGWRGFYRGILPTIVKFAPMGGLFFVGYERTRAQWRGNADGVACIFVSSCVGTLLSVVLTNPIAIFQSRCQTAGYTSSNRGYDTIWVTAKKLWRSESMLNLFRKGLRARLLAVGPELVFSMVSFELLMGTLQKRVDKVSSET